MPLVRRQEEAPGSAQEAAEQQGAEAGKLAEAELARAHGDVEGERKAHQQVDRGNAGDADSGPDEGAEESLQVEQHQGAAEVGAGEGDMADVDGQAGELAHATGEAEIETEEYVAEDRAVVDVEIGAEAPGLLRAEQAVE